MASVLIDCERVSQLGTGIGQFCYQLGRELTLKESGWFHPIFLVPKNQCEIFGPSSHTQIISWKWKSCPPLRPHFDLWHLTHESSHYLPIDKKSPLVLTIHDLHFLKEMDLNEGERRLKEVQKRVDRASAIIVISEHTEREVQVLLNLKGKPLYRIYNGLSPLDSGSGHLLRPDFVPEGPFLFSLGVIQPRKNFHVLIDFLAELPTFNLIIAGDMKSPYAQEIKKRAIEAKVEKRLILPGEVFGATKTWLYKNCTAFVFPSKLEGFGLPIIEAMSFGKPVFISNLTSLPEIGGQEAYYWNDFNPKKMKHVFHQGLEDFGLGGAEKIKRVKNWAHSFSWEKAAEQYKKIYLNLLGRDK